VIRVWSNEVGHRRHGFVVHDGVRGEVSASGQGLRAAAAVEGARVCYCRGVGVSEAAADLCDREEQEHQGFERGVVRAGGGGVYDRVGVLSV
jgi:hypothetical protein